MLIATTSVVVALCLY